MSKSHLRLTIETEAGPRLLLSIAERKQGDLVLDFKPSPYGREIGSRRLTGQIASQKFSVHCTPNAADGNTITHTTVFRDGTSTKHHHFSRAIKQTNSFAPIFVRRFYNLASGDTLTHNSKAEVFCLGEMQASHFTLMLGVFVGARDRPFEAPDDDRISVYQKPFGMFRVVVLWSFFPLPSDETSESAIIMTLPPGTADKSLYERSFETMEGYSEQECVGFFYNITGGLLSSFVLMGGIGPPTPLSKAMVKEAQFCKIAHVDGEHCRAFAKNVLARLRLP